VNFNLLAVMTEFEALHRRRHYLLEQIGEAADEINAIDARLAFLRSSAVEGIFSGSVSQP
jgi:hypothetical protein